MEIIIPFAAVIILWLLLTWSIKVFKASIKTFLMILAIILILQIAFGINSEQIVQEIRSLVNQASQFISQLILGK